MDESDAKYFVDDAGVNQGIKNISEIVGEQKPGKFDYTTCCPSGLCFGMNESAYQPDGSIKEEGVEVIICPSDKRITRRKGTKYNESTMWCTSCRPCKKTAPKSLPDAE